jgi:hypothetical protein
LFILHQGRVGALARVYADVGQLIQESASASALGIGEGLLGSAHLYQEQNDLLIGASVSVGKPAF